MNIIKYKDIYLKPEIWEGGTCPYTQVEMDWYNDNLKGKYAYSLNWRWTVPFSNITMHEFTQASAANSPYDYLTETEYCDISLYEEFEDTEATDRANSIDKYVALNKFSSDTDITLDEVKNFRTWLASTVRAIKDDGDMVRGEKIMLDYYAGGMYDSTVDALSIFSSVTPEYSVIGTSTCGCVSNSYGTTLGTTGSVCDPLAVYRKGIYDLMVDLWSTHKYWIDLESVDFLIEFKRYIDGIISYDLPLFITDWTTVFADCTCANSSDSLQAAGITAMRNLSQALQYMIDGEVTGHKNFIDNSLRVFASQYYERMQWI